MNKLRRVFENFFLKKKDVLSQMKSAINAKIFFSKNAPSYYKDLYKSNFIYEGSPNLGFNFFIDLRQNSKIMFDKAFSARGNFSVIGRETGIISIGKNVFFNLGCSISCLDSIVIGNNVLFGENVKIYDHNHEFKKTNELIGSQGMVTGKIVIGNNCWIGTNVVILKNVTIGDNSVIGTGCIIYKDIPSNSTVINQQNLDIKVRK
jgi:acetyltransferase-like isoleucine patch superfamily enzyme